MDEVLERCWRKKGGYPNLCKEGRGSNNAESHREHLARNLRCEIVLCIVIVLIVLDTLDTEMLAAHHIISHSSLDHTQP